MTTFLVTIAGKTGLTEEKMYSPTLATLKQALNENKIVWTTIFKLSKVG